MPRRKAAAKTAALLTAGTEITRQAITKHLQVLAQAGLHDVKVWLKQL